MVNKTKQVFLIIVLSIVGIAVMFYYNPDPRTLTTDSGWDSSYDSGSSSDWGSSSSSDWSSSSSSDWGSSSSHDYGSSNRNYNYSVSGKSKFTMMDYLPMELFMSVFYFAIIITLLSIFIKNNTLSSLYSFIIVIVRTILFAYLEAYISSEFIILNFALIMILGIVVSFLQKNNKIQKSNKITEDSYPECSDEVLKKYGIENRKEIEQEFYNIFVEVQNAWMNFDYDKLSSLCSDELYNSYKSDLEVLKLKHGQNIMNTFELKDIKIATIGEYNNIFSAVVFLHVTFYDYVIDTTTNKVIRGNKNKKMDNFYRLKFIKVINRIEKCPSCGSDIKDINTNKCEYCGNPIINNNYKYVLSEKNIM